MVDDLIPRPRQHLSQPAHVLPDRVDGHVLLRVVRVKLGVELFVIDDIAAMAIEQNKQPPKCGSQTAGLPRDHDHVSAPVDVPGLVEIIAKRDLLGASIAKGQGCSPLSRLCTRPNVARNCSEIDKGAPEATPAHSPLLGGNRA